MREDFKKFEAMLPAGGLVWDSVGAHQGVVLQARYRDIPVWRSGAKKALSAYWDRRCPQRSEESNPGGPECSDATPSGIPPLGAGSLDPLREHGAVLKGLCLAVSVQWPLMSDVRASGAAYQARSGSLALYRRR
jgi:hypothetical protein